MSAARRPARGIRLHRPRSLEAQDTTNHEGIPITSLARTLLDVAASLRSSELERALAQAERLRLYDQAAIDDVLQRANGHPGAKRLATATASEPAFTRSELEARFLHLIAEANLPRPLVNFTLDALDHGPIEVDFHWPAHHLIVETDGIQSHGTHAAFRADRRRDAALAAMGHHVVRFTWADVTHDTERVKSRLAALLSE